MSETAERPEEAVAPPQGVPEAPDQPDYQPPGVAEPVDLEDEEIDDEDLGEAGPREETEEEILVPKVDPVERVLSDARGAERTYTQAPFLMFQQTEMYGLLGRATRIVLEGESGLNMDDMFRMMQPKKLLDDMMSHLPGYEDAPDRAETKIGYEEAARMLTAFARLLESTPDTLKEAYCIILDVPKAHRNWAMEWSLPRVTIEEGMDIMDTFIDQNWGVLYGFFTEELPKRARRAAAAHKRFHESSGRRRGR